MHAGPHQHVRTWEGPTGAGGRRMVCVRQDNIVHAHLVGLGGVCMVSVQCLSDLGGGVNGHDVNLRDKCGVLTG